MVLAAAVVVINCLTMVYAPEAPPAASAMRAIAPANAPEPGAKPRPLQGAIATANASLRRGGEGAPTPESLVQSELAGDLLCEVTIAETKASETGTTIGRATLMTNRSVSVLSKEGDEEIRAASSRVSAARAEGERALRTFEKSWEPVKSDGTKYIRTHWGGCRKYWPRISANEYQNRRNAIIEKNQSEIAGAQEKLETIRERVRTEQNRIIQAAKTVNVLFTANSGSVAEELREGKRLKLVLRVEKVELAADPECVRNSASYVSTVHASVVTLAAAR